MAKVSYDFNGNNYVVTGASSGMGRQVAVELAQSGAKVLAIARSAEKLAELTKEYPENIIAVTIDVSNSAEVGAAVAAFVKQYGKLSGAVHAAGITELTPLRAYDEAAAENIMTTSFWAGVKLLQYCSKVKMANTGASFVLFSSTRAQRTDQGMFAYVGAKAAIQAACRSFAKELSHRKMRVNTISPGWVNTGMTQGLNGTHNLEELNQSTLLGQGQPVDVSGMILFLLSDRASWITGTNVVVDGGYLI